MKINHHQERLNAIKLKYVFSPTECRCCGKEFKKEQMYSVKRWGINNTVFTWHYCQNCMHSAEDVLEEIDTDGRFGIAFVDYRGNYPEKNYTKSREWFRPLPDPNGTRVKNKKKVKNKKVV